MAPLRYPALPRIVVAGLSGESGKTLVSLGLILAARKRGIAVRAFKKGPDYIDAAWLAWASGQTARNLDSYLMGFDRARESFLRHAIPDGLNVIEGNRGLFDGLDAQGTHSTAELAKALGAPVVLVVNTRKTSRTIAASVLGCEMLDPGLGLAGVVLNSTSGERHERVIRDALAASCQSPVVGTVPRLRRGVLVPQRHLGLITPHEYRPDSSLARNLLALAEGLDIDRILAAARAAPPLVAETREQAPAPDGAGLKIGYLKDSAFTFYYPENLEALESAGATLVPIPALAASSLPPGLDALYVGGGFPETHGEALSRNRPFLDSLRQTAEQGLPVYAECGGLMLLSRAIHWKGHAFPMAGVLPFDVRVCEAPQGHGYANLAVDSANPFFPIGTELKGHEFHYSKILPGDDMPATACAVHRGVGCYDHRDGVVKSNVLATYTHLHALATPEWARGMILAARIFAKRKT